MSTIGLAWELQQLLRAMGEERAAREGYDGGSWGYHGHYLIDAVQKAERSFEEAFNKAVDERVALALANLNK